MQVRLGGWRVSDTALDHAEELRSRIRDTDVVSVLFRRLTKEMGRGLSARLGAAAFIDQTLSHTSTRLVRTSGGFYFIFTRWINSLECNAAVLKVFT